MSQVKQSTANSNVQPKTANSNAQPKTPGEKLELDKTAEDDKKLNEDEQLMKKNEGKKGKKKSAFEEISKEEEKILRELDFYHGYVAREDLSTLLKNEGDFIVRMTEVELTKKKTETKKQIVLSMVIVGAPDEKGEHKESNQEYTTLAVVAGANVLKAKNVVIRRSGGMYRVESMKPFKTVKDLVEYYKNNYGQVNVSRFILKNPICQQSWEFSHEDFKLSDKDLGSGAYGLVKQGTLSVMKRKEGPMVDVAVKMARTDLVKKVGSEADGHNDMTKEKIKEMMREARMMRHLQHVNVVRLYGVAVLEQPLAIILELIKGGELKKYLRKGKVEISEKLKMSLGAASGLEYLHKKGFIHMDIAARNCLYTLEKVVKISDFGLSRQCVEYKMKKVLKLPIKWLAPETLNKFHFTPKTDVYSFGILLVEIFRDGMEPWPGKPNAEVKKSVLGGTFPSDLPANTPLKIKSLVMGKIMISDPALRASMTEIREVLESIMAEEPKSKEDSTGTGTGPMPMSRLEREKRSSADGRKKEEPTKTAK